MRYLRLAALLVLAGWACCSTAEAGCRSGRCPAWRPCGAGNTWGGNRFCKQGFYGADFRPACQCHDECLLSGACRRDCDQQFLCHMYDACECSYNPRACRRKARMYYYGARIFGGIWH